MKRLEEIIIAYWRVGTAVRHPTAPGLACGDALNLLNQSDRLLPNGEEANLLENMHTLRYDIIEGDSKWRENEKQKVQGFQLIQFTRN